MNRIELSNMVSDVAQASSPYGDEIRRQGLDSDWSPIELSVTALGSIKPPLEVMWRLLY
jgi:hypothetical protein